MPRATRAQGRPGTRVIPVDWSRSHAPVATKTMTGACQIFPPGAGPAAFNPTSHLTESGAVDPTYDGGCRVQQLKAQDSIAVVGDQTQSTIGYLVTISLEADGADEVTPAHTVVLGAIANDASLSGKHLQIRSIVRGTERFERDLFCVEDQSTPAT